MGSETPPERIYLQRGCDECGTPRDDEAVTWCSDRIEHCDVEYVRADLLTAANLALKEVRGTVDCEYFDGSLTVPEQRDGEWAFTETIVRRFKTEAEAKAAHKVTFLAAMKR